MWSDINSLSGRGNLANDQACKPLIRHRMERAFKCFTPSFHAVVPPCPPPTVTVKFHSQLVPVMRWVHGHSSWLGCFPQGCGAEDLDWATEESCSLRLVNMICADCYHNDQWHFLYYCSSAFAWSNLERLCCRDGTMYWSIKQMVFCVL